ncbi:MAG: hypothetical protein WC816_04620 [Sphingomonas sp.]|jgi:hypothetical protein
METLNQLAPSIAMLAVFALLVGGVVQLRRGANRQKAGLMLVLAVVIFGNVLVWAM